MFLWLTLNNAWANPEAYSEQGFVETVKSFQSPTIFTGPNLNVLQGSEYAFGIFIINFELYLRSSKRNPVDIGPKLKTHKTFVQRPGCHFNTRCSHSFRIL